MDVPSSYLEDASGYRGSAEQLFVPSTAEELSDLLARAQADGIPVTLRGAGTGVTGGSVPHGGWLLSLEKFRRLEVREGSAIAGAGVRLFELQAAAASTGQFYAPDPTENTASVGGTVATNASGSRSFRFGPTRAHVRGLQVVLPGGERRWFRRGEPIDFEVPELPLPSTTKHAVGFPLKPGMDWVDLFVGSEGILGVVLEAELTLLPRPASLLAGVVFLPSGELAFEAIDRWREVPGLRMLEFMDGPALRMLSARFPDIPARAQAALLVEDEPGGDEAVDAWLDRLEAIGCLTEESWFGTSDRDRERFRAFRHALPELVNDRVRQAGFQKLGSDLAVPPGKNLEMYCYYRTRVDQVFPDSAVIFGHAGDAHLHVNLFPVSEDHAAAGRDLMLEFARKALELGGTISAEHGLGKRKKAMLSMEKGPSGTQALIQVKKRLDPRLILGRGTLLDLPLGSSTLFRAGGGDG